MIRDTLRQVKQSRNITGRALSQLTGLSDGSISNFFNGKKDITVSNLWLILEAMEVLSPGSIESFCSLLMGNSSSLVLTEDQIADQIIALGKAWKHLQESKAHVK